MDKIRKFLGLNNLPHFTTIQKFFVRMTDTKLKDLNNLISFMNPTNCELVAMDGTGHTIKEGFYMVIKIQYDNY